MFNNVYKDKVVLVTGHTGFKGSWLVTWLHLLGAKVVGVALDPPSEPSHFTKGEMVRLLNEDVRIDIRNYKELNDYICKIEPDYIFHLAAQAIVKESYKNPLQTIETNALGTSNLINSIRNLKNEVRVIIITSDKCYQNNEWVWGYRETDTLGGKDPYSASKAMAELAVHSMYMSYLRDNNKNVRLAIGRAGNVIGGGDWAKDRIVPDCIKAWQKNSVVRIRSPYSTRPWQHVLEPLSGYLKLGEMLENSDINGEAFNFGPTNEADFTVLDLITEMSKTWKNSLFEYEDSDEKFHEAGLLKLNCDKAHNMLGWKPVLSFEENVQMTVSWYIESENCEDIVEITKSQINRYTENAKIKGLNWV